jgi:hypothetical protein
VNYSLYDDEAKSIVVDSMGDIIVTGFDSSPGKPSYEWNIMKFKSIVCSNGRIDSPYENCESDNDCASWQKCYLPSESNPCNCYDLSPSGCSYYDNCNEFNGCESNMLDCSNPNDICNNNYCKNAPRLTCLDENSFPHVLWVCS